MATRTRRNVYTLPAGDLTLYWYGQAVTAMKALPKSDARSWEYQGAVHGIAPVPSALTKYWAQCQHGSSFFLPWHRMYLLHFERIVAEHVVQLGGPNNWALPYWNYSAAVVWRALPAAFRGAKLANGTSNPLFVAQRKASMNAGGGVGAKDVDLAPAMVAPGTTGSGGFFGGAAAGHFSGFFGELEGTVHNRIHVAVGGSVGWMSDPDLAALDPIFWLHHANIDRLWEVWLARDPAHRNLTTPYWLTGVSFDFHNAIGTPVSMRTIDVLNLAAPALDYTYDDLTDPLAVVPIAVVGGIPGGTGPGGTTGGTGGLPPMNPLQRDLVGATIAPVVLGAQVEHVDVPTPVTPLAFAQSVAPQGIAPTGPPSQLIQQVMLQLENVTSSAQAPAYDVYVNVPNAEDPTKHEDRFIGRAAMFGIPQASSPSGQHGGGGQNFAFDITELYRRLSDIGEVSTNNLRVSFVPVDADDTVQVSVGRISLYFA